MKLPIFPLPIYLLPSGVVQLRIFEPRYLNLVKNANQTNGFVIAHTMDKTQFNDWGSWVDIVDFDTDETGLLNIMVQCKQLVALSEIDRTARDNRIDGLIQANTHILQHWPINSNHQACEYFQTQLEALFASSKILQQHYKECHFEQANWVCARWLEILPLKFKDKCHFAHQDSFPQAVEFLANVLGPVEL